MKVFEIVGNICHKEYPQYTNAKEASQYYSKEIIFVDAPDWVWPGYGYDSNKSGDSRFVRPTLSEGWEYDENGHIWNPEEHRSNERSCLHAATTNDTMQAYRKLREGDKTIDWQAWLDTLDTYNVAIEKTKEQEGYPLKVTYPEYPTKPTS